MTQCKIYWQTKVWPATLDQTKCIAPCLAPYIAYTGPEQHRSKPQREQRY